MKLTRIIFIALAIALPATWTVARATEGDAPAEGEKKAKKGKKGKKADAPEGEKTEEKKM